MNFVVAIVTTLATWLAVRLVLRRYLQYRRTTQNGQEWQQYKAKLPSWVKQTEMLVWVILWLPLMLAFIVLFDGAHLALHLKQNQPDGVSAGLVVMSSALLALVPALLLGNAISWLLPPMRRANLAAMQEFASVSYQSATMGLVKFAAAIVPVSLAVAILAVLAPWAI